MEFYLTYSGPLKANGRPKDKQGLRRVFHKQLKELWAQPSLKELGPPNELMWDGNNLEDVPTIWEVGNFRFLSLVTEELHLLAELKITLLR